MVDLSIIIKKYPQCLENRAKLSSILHDIFPKEIRQVNLALMVYDCGIATKISNMQQIDSLALNSFIKRLEDDFGVERNFALHGIQLWADGYSCSLVGMPQDKTPDLHVHNSIYNTATPVITQYSNIDYTVDPSDYEVKSIGNNELEIVRFIGFDKPDMIIPATLNKQRVVSIGKNAYRRCKNLKHIVVEEGIETIENGAFAECSELSIVELPESLQRIGTDVEDSFDYIRVEQSQRPGVFYLSGLSEIILPQHLKSLGFETFRECRKLKKITIPGSIHIIPSNCFLWCNSLEEVYLNEGLIEIKNGAFVSTKIAHIDLPSTVTTLQRSIFMQCDNLKEIYLPPTIKTIEDIFGSFRNLQKTIICVSGSVALQFAREHGYRIREALNT